MRTASTDDRHQRRAEFDEQVMSINGRSYGPTKLSVNRGNRDVSSSARADRAPTAVIVTR